MASKTFFLESDDAQYTDEELSFLHSIFLSEGVFNTSGDNTDLKVTEKEAGADMSVDVQIGSIIIEITKNAKTFKTINQINADVNIVIPDNATGSPRYDTIIARVDVDADLNTLKNNIFTVARIGGQATNPLTDGDITTLVGDDGWKRLADITVADSETAIETAHIEDKRDKVQLAGDLLVAGNTFKLIEAGENIEIGKSICIKTSDELAYKTKADDTDLLGFIGFAQYPTTIGNLLIVNTSGINNKQTGKAGNVLYYLSDTAGEISSTPGTYTVLAGRGISDTEILIINAPYGAEDSKIQQFLDSGIAGETLVYEDNVYLKASDGKLWKADADADESAYNTVGTIVVGGNADETVFYSKPGAIFTTSGKTAGDILYLSNTAGEFNSTPHANRPIPLALALSATKLLLCQNPAGMKMNIQTQNVTWGSTGNISIACGFRAQLILCISTSATALVGGTGFAIGSTSKCSWAINNAPYSSFVESALACFGVDTTNYTYYTVGSITDTGYTLTKTNAGSGASGGVAGTLTIISIGF